MVEKLQRMLPRSVENLSLSMSFNDSDLIKKRSQSLGNPALNQSLMIPSQRTRKGAKRCFTTNLVNQQCGEASKNQYIHSHLPNIDLDGIDDPLFGRLSVVSERASNAEQSSAS